MTDLMAAAAGRMQRGCVLTHIGTAPIAPSFADALGMLVECHGRIREHVTLATRLATAIDAPAAHVADAAARAHRYFTTGLLLHARDEDEDLFPELVARGADPSVVDVIEALGMQHQDIEELVEGLAPDWLALHDAPESLAAMSPALAPTTRALCDLLTMHIELEEGTVFPVVHRLVAPARLERMAESFRARRQRAFAARP